MNIALIAVGSIVAILVLVRLIIWLLAGLIVKKVNKQLEKAKDFDRRFPMFNEVAGDIVQNHVVLWISNVNNPAYVDEFISKFGAALSVLDLDPNFAGCGLHISYVLNNSKPSEKMAQELARLQSRRKR